MRVLNAPSAPLQAELRAEPRAEPRAKPRAKLPADRHLVSGTAFMGLLLLLGLAGLATDYRLLDGEQVWVKPTKFALAVTLHLATLAVIAARLSEPYRRGWAMTLTVPVVLVCAVGEMAYIILQAAAQEHSHFNIATPFHAAMYSAMGIGAVLLTGGAAVIGLLAARDRNAALRPGLRRGVVLGLIGGTVLTILVAGYLGSNNGHFVGTHPEGGAAVPLIGWSLETGDLRPAHFFALHIMQALPLIGLAFDRFAPARAAALTGLAALVWVGLTLAVFIQALAGLPLLDPGL
ncbi:MAG: hypothetical protein AAGC92_12265 [Pseudomonadota bacterium]